MYMETRGAISGEVSDLLKLKIKAPTQDKHVILKTIHTLKKAMEVTTNYSKVRMIKYSMVTAGIQPDPPENCHLNV